MRSCRSELALAGALLLSVPLAGAAQERAVVSKEIAVARDEAALHLELDGGGELDVALRDGEVRVDGDVVGAYTPGDALEVAWRSLLGQAVALDDGPLARALVAWDPPPLDGEAQRIARVLDQALDDALRRPEPTPRAAPDAPAAPGAVPDPGLLVRGLLGRTGRLLELAEALEGLDEAMAESLRLHVDEDVVVEAGERVEGSLLVVDGDVRVAGEVDGSVILVGGALTLDEGGRIRGDVRLLDDARLFREGGVAEGDVETVRAPRRDADRDATRERLRDEIRREIRNEMRDDRRGDFSYGGGWNPLRSIGRGLGGLLENLVTVLVLGVLVGGAAVHFAPDEMDVVGRTVREAPMRAAMVGVAGAFVALPAWVLGFVALAISIVGILAIPFWAALFPLAVAAAVGLGYVTVAQLVGEWVAGRRYDRLEWVRAGNPFSTVIAGVGALMLAFVLSNVLEMAGPWTGVFQGILVFLGVVASLAAALTGFGAVLLTRGGRRPEYPHGGFDDWGLDLDGPASPSGSGPTGPRPATGASSEPPAGPGAGPGEAP